MQEETRRLVEAYSTEAHAAIESRIGHLDDRLLPRLADAGELGAFADPAVIRAYRKAQEGAAASERELDYDMLAALIAKRVENPRERPVVAGIDRAIEIMDRVDEKALRGLTATYALTTWTPAAGSIAAGLETLDGIFERVIDGGLPSGTEWLDHLDILDAVRVGTSGFGGTKTIELYYGERLNGYVAPGVEAPGPDLVGGAFPDSPWGSAVVDHELKPGYRRLNTVSKANFDKQQMTRQNREGFNEEVIRQAASVFGLGQQDNSARAALRTRIAETPHLGPFADWWDSLKDASFQLTSVGRALARANCFRLDPEGYLPRD
nr:LPO_1073/Vpar_1526 family protein [Microbacterium sp. PM5]